MTALDIEPIGLAILGEAPPTCRWCSHVLQEHQEISWGICAACYDDCRQEGLSAADLAEDRSA